MNNDHESARTCWRGVLRLSTGTVLLVAVALLWADGGRACDLVRVTAGWLFF